MSTSLQLFAEVVCHGKHHKAVRSDQRCILIQVYGDIAQHGETVFAYVFPSWMEIKLIMEVLIHTNL